MRNVSHSMPIRLSLPTLATIREGADGVARTPVEDWISLFVYPLSGGFKALSLIPDCLVEPLLKVERKMERCLGWLSGFRLMVILARL